MKKEINIFGQDINIFGQGFISPFNQDGDNYYLFFVPETLIVNGEKVHHFLFKPRKSGTNTFTGDAWVTASNYQIKSITLYLGKEANVNYIDRISILQEFALINDSLYFLSRDKIFADFKIIGSDNLTFIAQKTTSYKNISINSDTIAALLKSQTIERVVKTNNNANIRDELIWQSLRHDSLSVSEQKIYPAIDDILTGPKYRNLQNTFKFLISGYKDFGHLEIGKWQRLYNYNAWEGNRFQLDIGTNKYFSKNHHIHAYLAYGNRDKTYKGLFKHIGLSKENPIGVKLILFTTLT